MSWSGAEIAALAAKAARGAGAPPEQAARFGQVAAHHLMAGHDPAILSAALAALPAGPLLAHPLAVDRALQEAAAKGQALLDGAASDHLLRAYVEVLPFTARLDPAGAGQLCLRVAFDVPRGRAVPGRITGCAALVAEMTALAEATYVPESEASRRAGAGAGLSDND